MNYRQIALTSTNLAISLICLLSFFSIIGIADTVFRWDILPQFWENVAQLTLAAGTVVMVASIIVSVLANLSHISTRTTKN